VVLLDGFQEWKARSSHDIVSLGQEHVVRMAGLYDTWAGGLTRNVAVAI
jgi:putative SOS response-associated peptidase YedK